MSSKSAWPSAFVCLLALAPLAARDRQHPAMGPMPIPRATTPVGPAVLENVSTQPHTVEVTLTAAPTQVSLVPGVMTPVYAYNGRFPGPVLEAHEGDTVIVHFRNDLPEMSFTLAEA